MNTKIFLLLMAFQIPVYALFSNGFMTFLETTYGSEIASQLARADLAPDASYGGGNETHMSLNHDPLIVVHGVRSYGGRSVIVRDFFESNGFEKGSVFASSYGPFGRRIDLNDTLLCEYVLQVRRLIEAVHEYTGRKVLIAAYSTGSAVSRKAILGGKCADNDQKLGKPLSSTVNKFLSMTGLNQGLQLCFSDWAGTPFCNNVTGAFPGSTFLKDINKRDHYEGKDVYAIGSVTDEIVGYKYFYLPKVDANVTLSGFLHVPTAIYTLRSQTELLLTGYLTEATLNADLVAATQILGVNCTGSVQQRRKGPKYS